MTVAREASGPSGTYGVNYPFRATIAKWGLGYSACTAADALKP